jgi:Ceramidase
MKRATVTLPYEPTLFRLPNRIHFLVWIVLLGLSLALLGLSKNYAEQNVWGNWKESNNLRNSQYAERIQIESFFRTRANAWSNLSYVVVGFYCIAFGWRDLSTSKSGTVNYLTRTPAMSLLFGVACCLLGFSSGFFHASLTRLGQQLDVASMYGPLLVLIAISLGSWVPKLDLIKGRFIISSWVFFAVIIVVAEVLFYRYKWSMSSTVVMITLLQLTSGLTLLDFVRPIPKKSIICLVAAVLTLVAGVICRQLDVAGRFSGPDTWLQGHSFWHVLTAASLGFMYLYHRAKQDGD